MPQFDISHYNITVSMDDITYQDETEAIVAIIPSGGEIDSQKETSSQNGSLPQPDPAEPWNRWLFSQLYDHLRNTPDKVALIEEVCEARCVTYGELVDGIMKTANYLTHHGIGANTRVGLCMENCVEYVFYEFALFLIGAVPVLFNPGHVAADRISKIHVRAIVVDSEHYGHVLRSFDNWTDLQQVFILSEDIAAIHVPRNVWVYDGFGYLDFPCDFDRIMEDNEGSVIAFATSGTSSTKGKIVAHGSASAQVICTHYFSELLSLLREKSPDYELSSGCHLISNGLHSIEGWAYLIYSLISGHTAVITESNADIWRASFLDRIAGLIEQYTIPLVMAHSQFMTCLVKYEVHKLFNISSLKIIAHSGSTIPSSIVRRIQDSMDVAITQAYSTTEFGVIAFDQILTTDDNIVSCGEPFLGTDIKIASVVDETEVQPGSWGRIMVRGGSLLSGYLCQSAPSSYLTKNGWFRTDDYGMLDEQARLFVSGPIDGVLALDGNVVSLAAAENVLVSHDSIDDVAIASLDDVISAGIVLREGTVPPSCTELTNLLREHYIVLNIGKVVLVDFVPRSETGKVIRLEVPFLLQSEETLEENESSI